MQTWMQWAVGREYKTGALVLFRGALYRCVGATRAGQSPGSAPEKWEGADTAQARAERALPGGFNA